MAGTTADRELERDAGAIARRILAVWARRYVGVGIGVAAFLVFVIIAPSRSPISTPFEVPTASGATAPQSANADAQKGQSSTVPTSSPPTSSDPVAAVAATPAGTDTTSMPLPPDAGASPAPEQSAGPSSDSGPGPAPSDTPPPSSPPPDPPPPSSPPSGPQPCQPLVPSVLGMPPVCAP